MRNLIISGVKTAVQVAVAALVAWATQLGIDLDTAALEVALFSVVTGAVTIALNWLSAKWPIVGKVLSFGLTSGTASY